MGKIKQQLTRTELELEKYQEEVIKVIMGESSFTRDTLSGRIKKKEQEVLELKAKRDEMEQELTAKKVEHAEMETLQRNIPKWREVFESATIAKRKMMLRTIIGGIRVYRDRVEVTFKLRISQFLSAMGSVENVGVILPDTASQYGKVLTHSLLTGNSVYRQAK